MLSQRLVLSRHSVGYDLGVRALPMQCFSCTKGPRQVVGEDSEKEDERREGK